MKKKLFVLLMPLLLFGLTGCVLYNGQGAINSLKEYLSNNQL